VTETPSTAIEVPKLNNNDTSYVLTDWLAGDGELLAAGDPVAVVETSKAAEELCVEESGVLHRLLPVMGECAPGTVIGRLFATEDDRKAFQDAATSAPEPADRPGATGAVVTEPARALAARHGIDEAALAGLGLPVVREADVRRLIGDETVH
jgi:2-oxoglutarate dehydrogenase E2 component (dihydrolipoamide succinyltransferase)